MGKDHTPVGIELLRVDLNQVILVIGCQFIQDEKERILGGEEGILADE